MIYHSSKSSSMGPIVSMAIRSVGLEEDKTKEEARIALGVVSIFDIWGNSGYIDGCHDVMMASCLCCGDRFILDHKRWFYPLHDERKGKSDIY